MLLNDAGVAKVSDFGTAFLRLTSKTRTDMRGVVDIGTPGYIDVAVMTGAASSLGKSSDVYSYSIMAWEVRTGCGRAAPFCTTTPAPSAPHYVCPPSPSAQVLTGQLSYSDLRFNFPQPVLNTRIIAGARPDVAALPADTPPEVREFITAGWSEQPRDRPTMADISATLARLLAAAA